MTCSLSMRMSVTTGRRRWRDAVEACEFDALGVYHQHAQVVGAELEEEAHDDGVEKDRFTAARRARHEEMWQFLHACSDRAPVGVPPQGNLQASLRVEDSSDSMMLRRPTTCREGLGTSIPMRDWPGMGASMRMPGAARARARLRSRLVNLLTWTPTPGSMANWVTAGPVFTSRTVASTLNERSVSSIVFIFALMSDWLTLTSPVFSRRVRAGSFQV